jgi:ASC-1-like (ASCH) protein
MVYTEIQPNIWKPINIGDSVEGVLVGMDQAVGRNESNIYSLEAPNGEKWKIWGSAILDDRLKYVKVGDKIKIVYEGSTVNKSGQPLKLYKVFRDTPDVVGFENIK